jgi:hypothetical protein
VILVIVGDKLLAVFNHDEVSFAGVKYEVEVDVRGTIASLLGEKL